MGDVGHYFYWFSNEVLQSKESYVFSKKAQKE